MAVRETIQGYALKYSLISLRNKYSSQVEIFYQGGQVLLFFSVLPT